MDRAAARPKATLPIFRRRRLDRRLAARHARSRRRACARPYTRARRRRRCVPHLRASRFPWRARATCARSSSAPATRASCTTPTSASIARGRRGSSTRAIPEPGYAGSMERDARYPEGQLLGWTPGQAPHPSPDGMPWRLEPGSDLVVQLHLQPTGKPEPLQVDGRLLLHRRSRRRARRSVCGSAARRSTSRPARRDTSSPIATRLPVDAEVLAVQPHAHNLARRMEATADAARRHDALAHLDRRLGFPLAGRLPLRARRSCCRRARRSRCGTSTTTPPPTRATRIIRRRASSGARTRRTRWATSGSRWCRAPSADFGDPDRGFPPQGARGRPRGVHEAAAGRSRPTRCATTRSRACISMRGQFDEAIAAYRAIAAAEPDSAPTHYNLAFALSRARTARRGDRRVARGAPHRSGLRAGAQQPRRAAAACRPYRRGAGPLPSRDRAPSRQRRGADQPRSASVGQGRPPRPATSSRSRSPSSRTIPRRWPGWPGSARPPRTRRCAIRRQRCGSPSGPRRSRGADIGALDALAAAYAAAGRFDEAVRVLGSASKSPQPPDSPPSPTGFASAPSCMKKDSP